MKFLPIPLSLFIALLGSSLTPQTSQGVESVLTPDALKTAALTAPSPEVAREIPVTADDTHEGRAVRKFQINAREMEFYVAQLPMPAVKPIAKDDTLYLTYDARTTAVRDESGQGLLTVFFQEAAPPWTKALLRPVPLTDKWTTYRFAFRAISDITPEKPGELVFAFGGREQTVEIANVTLTNHGSTVDLDSLPQTRATYKGREPDAPWRADAANRIDQFRKADLEVKVVDATGKPVPGAKISIEQQRHAFRFGSAVSVKTLNEKSPDADRYREIVRTWFNHTIVESALKWPAWVGEWDAAGDGTIEGALQWLKDQNIHIKGHVLIWPSFRHMPKAIGELKEDPEALRTAVNHRITEAAKQYRPYVGEWDVINEPFSCHDVMDILGNDSIAEWFHLAKAASPETPLYLNDYGILTGGDANNSPHRQHLEDTVTSLLAAKAPLEGIGMQGHFAEHLTPPEDLNKVLDRYARFGLPIQITEFDVDSLDETLQADYTRDFLTLIFSHPQVNAFNMWGFWETRHWRPSAAMFTKDWRMKPNGKVFHDLVFKEWWTNTDGTSSPDGIFSTRAFLGDYQITVGHDGRTTMQKFILSPDHRSVVITLPDPS